ncbi:hypothetical protein CEXT_594751 [Caerostris extrusa]|uniref:Uncharacterized protein n=1 Tax=Caerostris extrusa TaxID=172846 RepID=A0AAV4YCN6_CAEEX|nr:hypothetical protein CEXT_594751 [Caerostris extrusa]
MLKQSDNSRATYLNFCINLCRVVEWRRFNRLFLRHSALCIRLCSISMESIYRGYVLICKLFAGIHYYRSRALLPNAIIAGRRPKSTHYLRSLTTLTIGGKCKD